MANWDYGMSLKLSLVLSIMLPCRAKRFNNHEILAEDVRDWDIASDRGQGQRAQVLSLFSI